MFTMQAMHETMAATAMVEAAQKQQAAAQAHAEAMRVG